MRRTRSTVLGIAALVCLLVAAGCGSSGSGSGSGGSSEGSSGGEPQTVNVGIIPIVDVAPIYLGQKQGFFEDEGLSLKLKSGQGGAAIVPGVASGQFQFGFSNVTSLMIARDNNIPVKVVTAGNFSTGEIPDFSAVVAKDPAIESAKDLVGKTVAVNTLKNIGDTTVRESIRKDGGDPSKVKFVEMAFPDMPAAVQNGDVDAAWVVEPFVAVTKSQGDHVVAWNLLDTADNLMIAAYFTSADLEKSDPELVGKFTDAMNKSLDYASAHPEEARATVTSYTEIDKDLLKKVTLPKWGTEINEKSTQTIADLALQGGLVDEPVDLSALLP